MADNEAHWSFGSEIPDFAAPPPARSSPIWRTGERIGGRYVLEDRLGRGAHATVFRALDSLTQRRVALKVLDSLEPVARARLLREARLLARLNHPALLRVHDVLLHDDCMVLVLELVKGPTWEEALDRLEPDEGLRLLERVARGLGEAHRQGVVHRDVKPSNVLLAEDGPRLADFGLARASPASSLTQTGALVGTPTYMAPEQLEGRRDVGPQADVWALGVILFRLLTGQLPFRAPNLIAQCRLVARGAPRFGALGVAASPELEAVCARALTPDPELRFPDAAAFASALGLARESGRQQAESQSSRLLWPALVLMAAAVGLGLAGLNRETQPAPSAHTRLEPGPLSTDRAEPAPEALEPSTRWEIVDAHLRAGRPAEALEELDRLLAQAPALTEGWVRRGLALAGQQEWRAAVESFDRALALEPDHVQALEVRARVHWGLGSSALAKADRSELRRLARDRPAAEVAFARSCRVCGLVDEALAACDRAIERGNREAYLYAERALLRFQRGESVGAREDMAMATRLPSSEPSLAWLALGSWLQELGELEAAIQVLDRGLAEDDDHPDALTLRGFCKEQLGLSGAEDFDRALALGTTPFRASFLRGRVRLDARDADGALSDLERAWLSADTAERDLVLPLLIRARAAAAGAARGDEAGAELWASYLDAGAARDRRRSVALLTQLLELQPGLAEVWYRRGYARLQLREDEAALADLSRALELEPTRPEFLWARREALTRLGRGDEVNQDLEALVRLTPDDPKVWRELGGLAWAEGRLEEGARLLNRAVEVGGEFVDYTNRCLARQQLGDREGALADALRALELEQSAHVEQRLDLGRLLLHLEEWELALDLAERVLGSAEHAGALLIRAQARIELMLPGAEADLTRFLELEPGHTVALYLRGCSRLEQGRVAEALADLERVQGDPSFGEQLERKLAEARRRLTGD